MCMRNSRNSSRDRAGAAVVELALIASLLMLLTAGAIDFSRAFFSAITVANSAGTGSFFGSQSLVKSASVDIIDAVATHDAADLNAVTASPAVTVTSSTYCDCPDGAEVECAAVDCSGDYGMPRVHAKTRVEFTYVPLFPWPGVPNPIIVAREHYVRVQ